MQVAQSSLVSPPPPPSASLESSASPESDLGALRDRVTGLWAVEPRGRVATRRRLRAELQRLEDELGRLVLLATAGEYVPRSATRSCAARYYLLRRHWAGIDLAA